MEEDSAELEQEREMSTQTFPANETQPTQEKVALRLEALYNQVDAVKAMNLARIADQMAQPAPDQAETQKEAATVLKSVEIQLRILSEFRRRDGGEPQPELSVIWQALLDVPHAGALLRRDDVRKKVIEALRQRLSDPGVSGKGVGE